MRVLGTKSTTYSAPRYNSVCPRWRPNPFTSVTVMPDTPMSDNAARTSSSLKGLMIAVTSFMFLSVDQRLDSEDRHCQRGASVAAGPRPACTFHAISRGEIAVARHQGCPDPAPPSRTPRGSLPCAGAAPRDGVSAMLPSMYGQIVIVGAGQAADQAIHTLRRKGFTGKLTVVGDEPCLPYQRPPLSKKFLAGALERDRLLFHPEHFYAEHAVETRLGRRVEEIDRANRRIRLDDGTQLAYDALVLATGSRARPLLVPGADLEGVHTLRTIDDVDRIRKGMSTRGRLVVIGGGYIGLEAAATARELGLDVTVLEMADRVMSRVTCSEVSTFYETEHARHGVRIITNAKVQALAGNSKTGRVKAVLTEGGAEHPADLVIVGVGVTAADEIAVAA